MITELPKEETDILILTKEFGIVKGQYVKVKGADGKYGYEFLGYYCLGSDEMIRLNAIAWMPLPRNGENRWRKLAQ